MLGAARAGQRRGRSRRGMTAEGMGWPDGAAGRSVAGRVEIPSGTPGWKRRGSRVDATQEVGANHATYNARQAAYDLRKLRGKQLVGKLSRTRRDYLPGPAARTISALLTLRDYVIAPILAGVQICRRDSPSPGLPPVPGRAVARATIAAGSPPTGGSW